LADLAMRSSAAHDDQDFDPSLIQSWALVERLLTTLWERYIAEHRTIEIDETQTAFINVGRREFLRGRDFTASVVAEVLSLLGQLSLDLYERVGPVRRARNRWIHALEPVTAGQSAASRALALDLLRVVHDIDLDPGSDVILLSGV
jgi:hypothetical protein